MFIVMGATGHVGSATARELLRLGCPVTVVTRNARHADTLRAAGAEIAVADIHDVDGLRALFRGGQRLFLLNPPADPATDTDAVERETIRCLLAALEGSGLGRIVAESTAGVRPGERCGDLTTLYGLEQGLHAQGIPTTIIRASYYMSNWDAMVGPVRDTGLLPTMIPADMKIPMVAPQDLGRVAARLLQEPIDQTGVHYVEGPERYAPVDVANAFGEALGRPVRAVSTPRDEWEQAFRDLGFSEPAAQSYTRMTAVSVDTGFAVPDHAIRGSVDLLSYIRALVQAA